MSVCTNLRGSIAFKNKASRKKIKEIMCRYLPVEELLPEDVSVSGISVDDIFEEIFDAGCLNGAYCIDVDDRYFDMEIHDDIEAMFGELLPYLKNESEISIEYTEGPHYFVGYKVKNRKIIKTRSHDFFTDDSEEPSDNDVAEAITAAAEEFKKNPEKKNGIAACLSEAVSLSDILRIISLFGEIR